MDLALYRKAVVAIVSTLLMRWLLRLTGVDATALGLGPDVEMLVTLVVDLLAAAISGYLVWLFPNKRRE